MVQVPIWLARLYSAHKARAELKVATARLLRQRLTQRIVQGVDARLQVLAACPHHMPTRAGIPAAKSKPPSSRSTSSVTGTARAILIVDLMLHLSCRLLDQYERDLTNEDIMGAANAT